MLMFYSYVQGGYFSQKLLQALLTSTTSKADTRPAYPSSTGQHKLCFPCGSTSCSNRPWRFPKLLDPCPQRHRFHTKSCWMTWMMQGRTYIHDLRNFMELPYDIANLGYPARNDKFLAG